MASSSNSPFALFEGFKSPLSTTRFSDFELDGKKFNSVEQCYQYHKAIIFGNNELAEQIMADRINPLECRLLGDTVDTASAGVNWPEDARNLMERACMEKARVKQNMGLRKYLIKTRGNRLVNCDLDDRYWGIGLRKSSPKARETYTWLGHNHLGDILVRVRDTLLNMSDYQQQLKEIEKEEAVNKRKYRAKVERRNKKIRETP